MVAYNYSGTPPYGHLGNTMTSLLRPLFLAERQNSHTLSCKEKTLVNSVTCYYGQIFFWPISDRINGVPLYILLERVTVS